MVVVEATEVDVANAMVMEHAVGVMRVFRAKASFLKRGKGQNFNIFSVSWKKYINNLHVIGSFVNSMDG